MVYKKVDPFKFKLAFKYIGSETRIIHNKFVDVLWFKYLLLRAFDCQSAVFDGLITMKV